MVAASGESHSPPLGLRRRSPGVGHRFVVSTCLVLLGRLLCRPAGVSPVAKAVSLSLRRPVSEGGEPCLRRADGGGSYPADRLPAHRGAMAEPAVGPAFPAALARLTWGSAERLRGPGDLELHGSGCGGPAVSHARPVAGSGCAASVLGDSKWLGKGDAAAEGDRRVAPGHDGGQVTVGYGQRRQGPFRVS